MNDKKQRLTLPALLDKHQGQYTCIVTNLLGSIMHTVKVEALDHNIYKPKILERPHNQTIIVGMDAYFTCDVDGGSLTPEIHWAKVRDMESFDKTSSNSYVLFQSFQNKKELIIKNVDKSDEGLYICYVKNAAGKSQAAASLTVLDEFEAIEVPPKNITARVGADVSFHCGTPLEIRPFISWVRILDDRFIEIQNQSEVLRLDNITQSDEGEYHCVVGTSSKNALWETAWLTVDTQVKLENIDNSSLIILVVSVSAVVFVLIAIIFWTQRRLKKERDRKLQAINSAKAITAWTKKIIVERNNLSHPDSLVNAPVVRIERQPSSSRLRYGSENTTMTTLSEYELPLDPEWEFSRDKLTLGRTLGEGAFGKVLQADAFGLRHPGQNDVVAVKMLKEGHTDSEMIDLVSEMDMIKVIGRHINIINLLGACTQDGPLFVIVEFAEHGNLRDFLRKHRPTPGYERARESEVPALTEKQLISFSRQIAKGMEYLGSKKCIHRDLAARNVLVAEGFIMKIADFGLARDVHSNDYYRKMGDGRLPVKWMAPEALFHRRYTTQSDVWSFGILLWEIVTLGGTPYPSVPSIEKLFQLLRAGHRYKSPFIK